MVASSFELYFFEMSGRLPVVWVKRRYVRHRFYRVHQLLEVRVGELLDQTVGLHFGAPPEPAFEFVRLELEEAVRRS